MQPQPLDYETPKPKQPEDPSLAFTYPQQWRIYRRLWWLTWGAFLALLPAEIVIGRPLNRVFQSEAPSIVVLLIASAWIIVGGTLLSRWRCPRCGEHFHTYGWYNNPLARRCLNCGLPKR